MSPVLLRVCADDMTGILAMPDSAHDAVAQLLSRHWLDRSLERRDIMRMALRLNAHRAELRKGELPPMWTGDPPLWTCAQVAQVVGLPKLAEVTFVGLTGGLAGDALTYRLGVGYVMRLLREIGAPRFAELELRDLLGFCLLAKFGQNRYNRQYLLETHISAGIKKTNRDLYKRRHN